FARLEPRQFAVLLPECSFTQAQTVATELRESVNQSRFRWHDEAFELTMALGVIALAPGSTPPDAMRHALSALRVASGQGANRLHASPPQDAQHERRLSLQTWRSAVQEAIDGDQFQLFYQPIALCASLKAGAVPQPTHVEILLRMQHAEGGPIAAKDFITAAEQFSMMPTVDKWVVSRVFQLLDSPAFVDRTRDIDRFGINLSGQSISDPSFLDYVLGLTNAAGFDTRRIYFEITETAVVENLQRAQTFIHALRARGIEFALDDFGVGSSSYSYLRSLDVAYLKIDGAFVRDIIRHDADRAVVESMNQIGHSFGLRTVAEFVESPEQLDVLSDIGVDFAQGSLVGEPRLLT
ncbi:MAG: GGDEF domain-containing phosphodiesterase, partial [Gammaproteobacteria bacterium]|nr:GGDEF domain-containing phosphodiesterase [Gammaproteobacteria bacterium]